jgi:hypothetical protein
MESYRRAARLLVAFATQFLFLELRDVPRIGNQICASTEGGKRSDSSGQHCSAQPDLRLFPPPRVGSEDETLSRRSEEGSGVGNIPLRHIAPTQALPLSSGEPHRVMRLWSAWI